MRNRPLRRMAARDAADFYELQVDAYRAGDHRARLRSDGGGGSDDPNVFNEEMFSFRRITLAPLLVLFGFAFEVYAIMKKPEKRR